MARLAVSGDPLVTRLEDLEINRFLAQGELLARLQSDPSWEGWQELLRAMRTAAMEQLAIEKDVNEIRYWQGAAGALAEVLERPARIVAAAAEHIEIEESARVGIRPDLRAVVGMGIDPDGDF